ncbi:MAG: CaiB/BaiF CoA transferase family protein [Xanthobacteraceae bacterium]|uniref:CaiB/BaiF CoA transferase family protein n=1 Tax=Pseudolabrys sp. TaxID=1960880 RepID=UPI003D0CF8B3
MDAPVAPQPSSSAMALDGIVVLELGMVMQVPLAAQMLGDFGADVIKIERPAPGDILRTLDTVGRDRGEMSCYYAALCRNKRTLCLDIKEAQGRDALLRLVDRADVLLHNFRPGVMERLGLGFADIHRRNPRLIYAAGSAFGESGPMADLPGQDMLAQSFSGLAMSGVEPGESPRLNNTPAVDYVTAVSLTQGILAALVERQRSGRGQMVSTSLFDVALAMQTLEISSQEIYGYRTSWLRQSMVYRTQDGWLTVLTLFRDNPLQKLCSAFEIEDLSQNPKFATTDLQIQHLREIEKMLVPVFARFKSADCMARLAKVDILCAPVNDVADVVDHPQTIHNGTIWDVPIPGQKAARLAGNPVRLSRTPPKVYRQPTALGADSDGVLASFGFSPEEIQALRGASIVR